MAKRNNMYMLDSDRQDVVEGFVQRNKTKSTSQIYSELKKDNYFKDVDEKTLKSAINDTKKIYGLNSSFPVNTNNVPLDEYFLGANPKKHKDYKFYSNK